MGLFFCGAVVLKLLELWAGVQKSPVMGEHLVCVPQVMDCIVIVHRIS